MRPVAGAASANPELGAEVAAPPAELTDEAAPETDRDMDEARDIDMAEVEARDIVVGALAAALDAESESEPAVDEPAMGAAPFPPPEAETAPRAAASPVAATPQPEAVRVGAWYASRNRQHHLPSLE